MVDSMFPSNECFDKTIASRQFDDPTPDEICARAATIRSQWSEHQRERRRVNPKLAWQPTRVCLDEWVASITSALTS